MANLATTGFTDPIHGVIGVTANELALIDSAPLQRLRYIKQLGLSEFAFPGACHSRFAHSLGAMHMASRMLDAMLAQSDYALDAATARRFRQAVRLATLCHDLGHPPLSHVSERMMPPLASLALPDEVKRAVAGEPNRQASHEDYTLLLLYSEPLRSLIEAKFADDGITLADLATLMVGQPIGENSSFVVGALSGRQVDWLPALHAIISGELDADRMDYLRRDAHFTGVTYGAFDAEWLCTNLTVAAAPHEQATGNSGPLAVPLALALRHKAVWGFENFLLARYHMFLAVYYHHTSVCFEHLLGRFFADGEYVLPSTAPAYLQCDDIDLWSALRRSKSRWGRSLCQRRSFGLVLESHDFAERSDWQHHARRLRADGIDFFVTESEGRLSRYFGKGDLPLQVLEPERGRVRPINAYTPLYERFALGVQLLRLYAPVEEVGRARALVIAISGADTVGRLI